MITEIAYVVDFVGSFLQQSKLNISYSKIQGFKISLAYLLVQNYSKYWDILNPEKFKNLRSIRFNYYIDPIVLQAFNDKKVGLPTHIAAIIFPIDVTIYCDPYTVTYKSKDKIFTLYKHNFDSHI